MTPTQLITAGYWSTYWYNGHIFASEMSRGIDVFKLTASEHLSQHEIDAANLIRSAELNVQQQSRIVWPPAVVVARAYLDQLTRSKSIQTERAGAVKSGLDRLDRIKSGKDKGAAVVLAQLDGLVKQLEADATTATGRDAVRLRALASTIKTRAASLR